MKVNLSASCYWWVLVVYDSPNALKRAVLWSTLSDISKSIKGDWIMAGYFNSMLYTNEKKRDCPLRDSDCENFHSFMQDCGLLDLGFKGSLFMWEWNNIVERLDKCLSNLSWRLNNSKALVFHLPKLISNHCPILLVVKQSLEGERKGKPFKFLVAWLLHEDFDFVVAKSWKEKTSIIKAI